jgi:hypothetical protein
MPSHTNITKIPPKRYARALGDIAGGILQPVFSKKGFSQTELISGWADIVGPDYADVSMPEQIKWPRRNDPDRYAGATLIVRIEGAFALGFQHEWPVISERLNVMFGYKAISELRLIQGSVQKPGRHRPEPKQLDEDTKQSIQALTKDIDDEALRKSLEKLGESIYREKP